MPILVLGASGQVGRFVLSQLDALGLDYLAVSRQPPPGDPRWIAGALPEAMPSLPPLRAVVCLGPLDHLAPWLSVTRLAGTPHVIATSSMSAETKRDSEVPAERDLSRRLRDAETKTIATCASRGMPWNASPK